MSQHLVQRMPRLRAELCLAKTRLGAGKRILRPTLRHVDISSDYYMSFSRYEITQGGRGGDPSSGLVKTRMDGLHAAKNKNKAL
jgi:hypothetical protein